MPDWLRELQQEVADTSTSVSSSSTTAPPDWLSDLAPTVTANPTTSPPPPEPPEVASWLESLGTEPPLPAAPEPPPAEQQTSTTSRIRMPVGATDWLRSMGHPDARSEPLTERVSAPEEPSGVPDWLRDMSEDEVSRAVEAEVPKTQPRFDPEVSGWLVEDTPAPDASTVSANWMARSTPSEETSDQAPDWLQEAVAAEASEAERGGPAQTPPSNLAGSAEMPAWLRDLGGAEEASEEELPADADDEPAWLRDAANRPPTDRLAGQADEVEVFDRPDHLGREECCAHPFG